MIENKFRAWHEGYTHPRRTAPKMLYDDKPGDCLVWKNNGQPVIVMQHTGLKDNVNGKKIYGGDIVKWFGFEVKAGKQIRPERFITVTFDIPELFKLYNIITHGGYRAEVVGNIHESKATYAKGATARSGEGEE